jgi:hypothetical protein
MPIHWDGVLLHAMSGSEVSRLRTEFRPRLREPINKSPLESRGPTLLSNHVEFSSFRLVRWKELATESDGKAFGNVKSLLAQQYRRINRERALRWNPRRQQT